ncbi:hypothetical protein LIA77_08685 [Sarocladium implicatum]|nr:hypothetical protein LIA77_08685 [Sarocladium implicatum]
MNYEDVGCTHRSCHSISFQALPIYHALPSSQRHVDSAVRECLESLSPRRSGQTHPFQRTKVTADDLADHTLPWHLVLCQVIMLSTHGSERVIDANSRTAFMPPCAENCQSAASIPEPGTSDSQRDCLSEEQGAHRCDECSPRVVQSRVHRFSVPSFAGICRCRQAFILEAPKRRRETPRRWCPGRSSTGNFETSDVSNTKADRFRDLPFAASAHPHLNCGPLAQSVRPAALLDLLEGTNGCSLLADRFVCNGMPRCKEVAGSPCPHGSLAQSYSFRKLARDC